MVAIRVRLLSEIEFDQKKVAFGFVSFDRLIVIVDVEPEVSGREAYLTREAWRPIPFAYVSDPNG